MSAVISVSAVNSGLTTPGAVELAPLGIHGSVGLRTHVDRSHVRRERPHERIIVDCRKEPRVCGHCRNGRAVAALATSLGPEHLVTSFAKKADAPSLGVAPMQLRTPRSHEQRRWLTTSIGLQRPAEVLRGRLRRRRLSRLRFRGRRRLHRSRASYNDGDRDGDRGA